MSSLILPQLRVKSGFTFREAYGKIDAVVDALKELQTPFAALVDGKGTWGHVRYQAAAKKAGIKVGLGMEFPVINEGDFKPVAWMLAKDTRKFYNHTSRIMQRGVTAADVAEFEGVIRFAGCGLTDNPDSFDYIDLSPESALATYKAIELHRYTGKPLVITSANIMPRKDHRRFAAAWESRPGIAPDWIMSGDDLRAYMLQFVDSATIDKAIENTFLIAEELGDIELPKAPIIQLSGDLEKDCREGMRSRLERGHIAEWSQEYEVRLKHEIEQIKLKEFDSYFTLVSDLVRFAKKYMLVGPARGSAAGSLVCYLLDITEVDPLKHGLMFERFIDVSRGGFVYNGGFKGFGE